MSSNLSVSKASTNSNVWQQIIDLDSKYTRFQESTDMDLYRKKRHQIIKNLSRSEAHPCRKQYLKMREMILTEKYNPVEMGPLKKTSKSRTPSISNLSDFRPKLASESKPITNALGPSAGKIDSETLAGKRFPEERLFTGMHHVFDHHKGAVIRVHFANNDKSLLACCSMDGTLSICQLTPPPATVLYILQGHKSCVYEFEWSLSNDLIVSCSFDSTLRLWDTGTGKCLRVIRDPTESPILTCSFQPSNNNVVVLGNYKGYIHVINVSTGIPVKGGSLRTNTDCRVQCLVFESGGRILWAADSKGYISSFLFDLSSGRLSRLTKSLVNHDSPITGLSVKNWVRREKRLRFLLVNCPPNGLLLFEVSREMRLILRYRFHVKHQNKSLSIKSSFGPLTSNKEAIYVASGSEDSEVYFYGDYPSDKSQHDTYFLNKLQGHSSPVLDVCFNYDESLLATSDSSGNIIVWKKESS